MYCEYFSLRENPFSLAPDPRYLYLSEEHREALAHLLYGTRSDGGFVLLTGEVGTGKTTVCRSFLESIPESCRTAYIFNPKVTALELLSTICDEFGLSSHEEPESVKTLTDRLNSWLLDAHSRGLRVLLIIDEAQNLTADVLEQLRLLTNLETNRSKLLQIILLGQPELRQQLSRPELRQLSQRITARCHLGPLAKKEMTAYVSHRLSIAGAGRRLFSASSIDLLYRLSGGIPRLVNIICDRALLGAYSRGEDEVSRKVMGEAAGEVSGESPRFSFAAKGLVWAAAFLLFGGMGALLAAGYRQSDPPPPAAALTEQNRIYQSEAGTAQPAHPPPVDSTPPIPNRSQKLRWPVNIPMSLSRDLALEKLFEKWGLSYRPGEGSSPCKQAESGGLRCIEDQGTLRELSRLDRPAILRFFDSEGQEFYAVLDKVEGTTAVFLTGDEAQQVDIRWFGSYTLLWKPPPGGESEILPGRRSPDIPWVRKQLSILKGREEAGESPLFDPSLEGSVRKFQRAEGLLPDGILGPRTLIHLNTAAGIDGPRLKSGGRG